MKIALINQRYGLEVNGGSELYTRMIAEKLSERYEVEVLTSCAVDYVTWANYYKPGVEEINGVTVRRFPTIHERVQKVFSALDIDMHLTHDIPEEQAEKWIEEMGPYVPDLICYLREHKTDYDVVIVVTYLYYQAVKSIPVVADRLLFIPTAHQEPYLHFKIYESNFKMPKAYVFLTEEERNLVQKQFHVEHIKNDVMGVGIDVPECVDSDAFKKKYGLDRYIVYVGRIDYGKDCHKLFQYFLEYKKRNQDNIKLVLMGKAVMNIPKHEDILSLGFVSDEDKFNGIQGANALVLPSKYESLSISVLEAMELRRPVLVNGICDVLKGHCTKSNGGLYYTDYFEFEGCLKHLQKNPDIWEKMGVNGYQYVNKYFKWDVIMKKFDNIIAYVCQGKEENHEEANGAETNIS